MSKNNQNSDKKKALLEHKEKLLTEIKYYDKRIKDFQAGSVTKYYDESSDEDDFPTLIEAGDSLAQLTQQKLMLETCIQATEELTSLQILQSEMNILVENPVVEGEPAIREDGQWREITAECRIDLVPFSIMFIVHTPHRPFGGPSYRSLRVLVGKTSHELELANSILASVKTPGNAVEVLRSYSIAYRSRRTTLAALADKYAHLLHMEAMAEGGYLLKCANLLQICWTLENKKSPVASFHHKMKFELEYMDESYIKTITQAHKSLANPLLSTDERTLLLAQIISTCLQARGENDESEAESINTGERQAIFDDEPVNKEARTKEKMKNDGRDENVSRNAVKSAKKTPNDDQFGNADANKNEGGKRKRDVQDEQIMAPPKSLPKKAKRSKESEGDDRKATKRQQNDENGSSKRARNDENAKGNHLDVDEENLANHERNGAQNDKNEAKNYKNSGKNDKNTAKNDNNTAKNDKNTAKNNKNTAKSDRNVVKDTVKNEANDKNKPKATITDMVLQNEAKNKQISEKAQTKEKVQEKSNTNEKDKNKTKTVTKDNNNIASVKNNAKTHSGKVANAKDAHKDNNSAKSNAVQDDKTVNKVASVKNKEAVKNVANKEKAQNGAKNVKNDKREIAKEKNLQGYNKSDERTNTQNKLLHKQEDKENRNHPNSKPRKGISNPNAKVESKIQKRTEKTATPIENKQNVASNEKYNPKLIANKRFDLSPKRSPRLQKIALNSTFSIEKVTVNNVANKNTDRVANIASVNGKVDKSIKRLAKNYLPVKNLRAIAKDGVSKIPQKFKALSESSLKNHSTISPRKMVSTFKSKSDSKIKKIHKPITNIPRLMKIPLKPK